jgi:hypothetical protein
MTFLAKFGHWLIVGLVAIAWALDREKLISDQVHGTVQVAIAALGVGKVGAFIHAGNVVKAESVLKTAQADADAVATRAEQVSKLIGDILGAIREMQGAVASKDPPS